MGWRGLLVRSTATNRQSPTSRLVTALICRVCAWRAGTAGRASLGGRYTEPADALRFQIGANATDMDTIAVTFVDVVDIAHAQLGYIPQDANHEAFRKAIGNIHTQITTISSARGELGAIQAFFDEFAHSVATFSDFLRWGCLVSAGVICPFSLCILASGGNPMLLVNNP